MLPQRETGGTVGFAEGVGIILSRILVSFCDEKYRRERRERVYGKLR